MIRFSSIDQDCYDFIRRWEDKGKAESEGDGYEREDVSLLWLELKGVDVFVDNSDPVVRGECDLAFTVAILLVKIRVLLGLKSVAMAYIGAGKSENEDNIAGLRSGLSDAITRNPRMKDVLDAKHIRKNLANLKAQTQNLYLGMQQTNAYFWPAMVQPGSHLAAELQTYEKVSVQEMETCISVLVRCLEGNTWGN